MNQKLEVFWKESRLITPRLYNVKIKICIEIYT